MTNDQDLAAALLATAREADAAADRAETLAVENDRREVGAALRRCAVLFTECAERTHAVAEAFLSAGRKIVAAYDQLDMDAVHESRAARRAEPRA